MLKSLAIIEYRYVVFSDGDGYGYSGWLVTLSIVPVFALISSRLYLAGAILLHIVISRDSAVIVLAQHSASVNIET